MRIGVLGAASEYQERVATWHLLYTHQATPVPNESERDPIQCDILASCTVDPRHQKFVRRDIIEKSSLV